MAFKVLSEKKDQILTLHFHGSIDEDVDLNTVSLDPGSKKVVIDLADLESINSCGGRTWITWLKALDPGLVLSFTNCTPVFLDYVNMIEGFVPKNSSIESFSIPYYCESCDFITSKKFRTAQLKSDPKKIPESTNCEKCKKPAEIDVVTPAFFRFLKNVD